MLPYCSCQSWGVWGAVGCVCGGGVLTLLLNCRLCCPMWGNAREGLWLLLSCSSKVKGRRWPRTDDLWQLACWDTLEKSSLREMLGAIRCPNKSISPFDSGGGVWDSLCYLCCSQECCVRLKSFGKWWNISNRLCDNKACPDAPEGPDAFRRMWRPTTH